MFCSVHKWFISASLDTAKPLPAIVRRHMTHCRSCTDFAAGADSLGNRLVVDGQKLLVHSHRELEERIVSSLPGMISPDSPIVLNRGSDPKVTRPGTKMRSFFGTANSYLRPALAAAMLVMVVSLGIWFYSPASTPIAESPAEVQATAQAALGNIGDKVDIFAASLESPLHKELEGLQAATSSMKTFFLDYLDVKKKTNGS